MISSGNNEKIVDASIGDSYRYVKSDTCRGLTVGEKQLAIRVFKDSVNYNRVKMHHHSYTMGLPPEGTLMTPNGEIYAVGATYEADWSKKSSSDQSFFIHEMTHVWQYQRKIKWVIMDAAASFVRHLGNYEEAYKYTLHDGDDLASFGLEQQAAIVQDYFRVIMSGLDFLPGQTENDAPAHTQRKTQRELLEGVMQKFVANPSYLGG